VSALQVAVGVALGGAGGRGGPARLWWRPSLRAVGLRGEAGRALRGKAGQARGGGGSRVAAGARREGRRCGRGVEARLRRGRGGGRARRGLASGARARS
jgi:hypothetical protein